MMKQRPETVSSSHLPLFSGGWPWGSGATLSVYAERARGSLRPPRWVPFASGCDRSQGVIYTLEGPMGWARRHLRGTEFVVITPLSVLSLSSLAISALRTSLVNCLHMNSCLRAYFWWIHSKIEGHALSCQMLILIKHLLHAKHYMTCFKSINLLNPLKNPMSRSHFSFYEWENWALIACSKLHL